MKYSDRDNIIILGVPFGFTPMIFDNVVECLGYEEHIDDGVAKAEYLNIKTMKVSATTDHVKVKQSEPKYWCGKKRKYKEKVLNQVYNYSLDPTIIRDTTEPEILHSFISRNNPKTLVVDYDVPYIAMNCSKRDVYFPTNILDLEENDESLIESLDYVKNLFTELDEYNNTEIINIDNLFDEPKRIYEHLNNLGFETKEKKSIENLIKRASESYKKDKRDKKYKEIKNLC